MLDWSRVSMSSINQLSLSKPPTRLPDLMSTCEIQIPTLISQSVTLIARISPHSMCRSDDLQIKEMRLFWLVFQISNKVTHRTLILDELSHSECVPGFEDSTSARQ